MTREPAFAGWGFRAPSPKRAPKHAARPERRSAIVAALLEVPEMLAFSDGHLVRRIQQRFGGDENTAYRAVADARSRA